MAKTTLGDVIEKTIEKVGTPFQPKRFGKKLMRLVQLEILHPTEGHLGRQSQPFAMWT